MFGHERIQTALAIFNLGLNLRALLLSQRIIFHIETLYVPLDILVELFNKGLALQLVISLLLLQTLALQGFLLLGGQLGLLPSMVIRGIPAIASGGNTRVKYILDLNLWKPHDVLIPWLVEIRTGRSLSLMYLLELDHSAFPLQIAVDLLYIAILAEVPIQHAYHVIVLGQIVYDYGIAFEFT